METYKHITLKGFLKNESTGEKGTMVHTKRDKKKRK